MSIEDAQVQRPFLLVGTSDSFFSLIPTFLGGFRQLFKYLKLTVEWPPKIYPQVQVIIFQIMAKTFVDFARWTIKIVSPSISEPNYVVEIISKVKVVLFRLRRSNVSYRMPRIFRGGELVNALEIEVFAFRGKTIFGTVKIISVLRVTS